MGYVSVMSSSFVFQPHVHQSDGSVITPDILIERVYLSRDGTMEAVPATRLTSAAVLQQSADAPVGTPAVVLLAASYGMLVAVGAIFDDALAIGRAAWRHDDIRNVYDDIVLRSWTVEDGKRSAFLSEKLGSLQSPPEAMGALGNSSGLKPGTAVFISPPEPLGESLAVDRLEVALESDARVLQFDVALEALV